MSIDQNLIALINAEIDGEINSTEKAELDAILAESEAARDMYNDLGALCESLHSIEEESPPAHLKHVIMNRVKAAPAASTSPNFLQMLLGTPVFKYAGMFVAGVLLTLTIVTSDQVSEQVFDDVTGLVGTVSNPISGHVLSNIPVDNQNVAGKVSLRSSGSMLILDFDLTSSGPIEIEADYTDRSIWFNGFAQLESSGTTISIEDGSVTLGMEGSRRYAVYLQNGDGHGITVHLRFIAGGEIVHEASLEYEPGE